MSTERSRRRRLVPAVLAVVLALLAGACSSSTPRAAPPSTLASDTSTSPATSVSTTSTSVRASSTSSTTRTTIGPVTIGPGTAFISGTVQGPAGPVDGATVHVERLVGSAMAAMDVTTAGGGAWRLDSVLGGAYRVRAFKAPDFGQSEVEVFFLAANDRKSVDLRLGGTAGTSGPQIIAVVNPSPPRVNQPAIVTVQIGFPRTDDQGRPVIAPQVGIVLQLSVGAGLTLESSPQVATDSTGAASWRVRCLVEGASSVSLTTAAGAAPVNLPPCAAAGSTPAATTSTTKAR